MVKTSQIMSRVAIVTGGGRGLGRAMVLGLAQSGIHVVATAARERAEIEAVAEEVRQSCGESRVLPLVADVTKEDDCAEVVNAAVKRFGRGFSPYGPSKAALESETIIWAQDLQGTDVTVNALLPGGATLTGMVPQTMSQEAKSALLDPSIIVPPLLWLVSPEADGMTGRRLVATKWQTGSKGKSAAEAA